MKQLSKMLRTMLYLVPRAMMFAVFVLCFLITALVSFDCLVPNDNSLEGLLARTMRGVRDFTFGETANKKNPRGSRRQHYESSVFPKTSG